MSKWLYTSLSPQHVHHVLQSKKEHLQMLHVQVARRNYFQFEVVFRPTTTRTRTRTTTGTTWFRFNSTTFVNLAKLNESPVICSYINIQVEVLLEQNCTSKVIPLLMVKPCTKLLMFTCDYIWLNCDKGKEFIHNEYSQYFHHQCAGETWKERH